MHKQDTATQIKFDVVIQITLEHVLAQRLKQSIKQTVQVSNINEWVYMNAAKPGKS